MLFFALSGFALSISWQTNSGYSYRKFITRRIFRIYPAFFVAWCIALTIHNLVKSHGYDGGSLTAFWHVTNLSQALTQLALVLTENFPIDPPAWSLTHEMRISLVFPLIAVLCLRIGPARSVLLATVIYGILWIILRLVRNFPDDIQSVLMSMHYIVFFMFGITVATLYFSKNLNLLHNFNTLTRSVAWIIAFAMMCPIWYSLSAMIAQLTWAVGGSALIALTLTSENAAAILALKPIIWLGRVSYSLYLVHMPILYFTLAYVSDGTPSLAAYLIAAFGIAVASEAIYRWIERPFIRLGHRLSNPRLRPAEVVKTN
jgi:peptidoglycan/LPS O-acetylase OafA/YrhL